MREFINIANKRRALQNDVSLSSNSVQSNFDKKSRPRLCERQVKKQLCSSRREFDRKLSLSHTSFFFLEIYDCIIASKRLLCSLPLPLMCLCVRVCRAEIASTKVNIRWSRSE